MLIVDLAFGDFLGPRLLFCESSAIATFQYFPCFLNVAFYPCKEVEVMVNSSWRRQQRFLYELRGVALPRALGPLLMPLVARQRTCSRGAPWTLIL
jgi:hypothetical protein